MTRVKGLVGNKSTVFRKGSIIISTVKVKRNITEILSWTFFIVLGKKKKNQQVSLCLFMAAFYWTLLLF